MAYIKGNGVFKMRSRPKIPPSSTNFCGQSAYVLDNYGHADVANNP